MIEFIKQLAAAADSLGQAISESRLEYYAEHLKMMDEEKLIKGLRDCMLEDRFTLPSVGTIRAAALRYNPPVDNFVDDDIDNSPEEIARAMRHSEAFKKRMGWR